MIKRLSSIEWKAYVKKQLDAPKDRATYVSMELLRLVPISLVLGILVSAITIYFWGFREWARMMMQLLLGLTLAAAFIAPMIKRLEKKFQ